LLDERGLPRVVGPFNQYHVTSSCIRLIPRQPRTPFRFVGVSSGRSLSRRLNHARETGVRVPRADNHHSLKARKSPVVDAQAAGSSTHDDTTNSPSTSFSSL